MGGAEVRVAVLSTALPSAIRAHPVFAHRLEPQLVTPGAASEPSERIGVIGATAVAHIAAIAPTARILPVAVFDDSAGMTDELTFVVGLQQATEWAPDIVLLHFGASTPVERIDRAVTTAASFGIMLFAPAGNSGKASPSWPASSDEVLGVAAVVGPEDRLAEFSSYGKGVAIAAPGVDVVSLNGVSGDDLRFLRTSGTSVAAGIATGVAALALSMASTAQRDSLAATLKETGRPVRGRRGLKSLDARALVARMRDAD